MHKYIYMNIDFHFYPTIVVMIIWGYVFKCWLIINIVPLTVEIFNENNNNCISNTIIGEQRCKIPHKCNNITTTFAILTTVFYE